MNCEICENEVSYRWTDSHGIAACIYCGAPYKLYHYENDKRIEKPPELLLLDPAPHRQYWNEQRRNVAPGAFNFPGSSYEVADREDFEIFNDWWEANVINKETSEPAVK